jgi:hypothetical protein
MVTLAVFPPKQMLLVCEEMEAARTVGCVMVTGTVVVQLLLSLTVTVYAPAKSEEKVPDPWKVVPLIEYVYAGVPLFPATVTLPVLAPKQRMLVCAVMAAVSCVGSVMITGTDTVHPLASLAMIVYEPAVSVPNVPLATKEVPPLME